MVDTKIFHELLCSAVQNRAANSFGFAFYFSLDRAPHLNSFGHLQTVTEAKMFIPAFVGVFAGFLQMMMREKAGLARPKFGQLIPPHSS